MVWKKNGMEETKKILAVDGVLKKIVVISPKLCNIKAVVRDKYTRLKEP